MKTKILTALSLLVLIILIVVIGVTRESPQPLDIPVAITSPDDFLMQPIWSPDGRLLAASGENYRGIWIMDADGSNLQKLTDDVGAGYKFAWSPDSRAIAARVQQYEGRRRFHLITAYDLKSGSATVIKKYASSMVGVPVWAADNKHISLFEKQGLEVLDTGREASSIAKSSGAVLAARANALVMANSEGQILAEIKPVEGTYLNAVLSPNAKHIAFEVLGGNLYSVNADGTELTDLGPGERPCWSPDGRWIAYVITSDDGHQMLSSDVYVTERNGANKRNLTNSDDALEMNPNWSPDGRTLVFDEKKSGRLYKLTVPQL